MILFAPILALSLVQQPRRGAAASEFLTTTPESPLNVIAGNPTSNSITLSIKGKPNSDGTLRIRLDQGRTQSAMKFHFDREIQMVPVTGLRPHSRYSYTVENDGHQIEGSFVTARGSDQPFVFDVQADSHLDQNCDLGVYRRTLENILADKPDFLIDLGDTFMVDKYAQPKESLAQYRAQRYWFSLLGQQMSVFLCLGNHDGEVGWSRDPELTTWAREQRETFFPSVRPDGIYTGAPKVGLYYAWTWGNAEFIVLDPFVATTRKPRSEGDGWNWTLGTEQFRWLETSLRESKAPLKFVFIHHLVGGFGREARGGVEAADRFEWGDKTGFAEQRKGWAEPIHELMRRYKVTAMFHGHDHLYVRQEKDGIAYVEVPQPSIGRGDATRSAEDYGYRSGVILGSSGHLRVSVNGKEAKIEYVKSRSGEDNRKVVDSVVLRAP